MRKVILIMAMMSILGGCGDGGTGDESADTADAPADSVYNPFFVEWDGVFGTPPFDKIEIAHYEPAMMRGMAEHQAEITEIARGSEYPNFANTIEAMDAAGTLLTRVGDVFGAMNGTMTNDEMQAIAKRLAPLRSKHRDAILLNPELFSRVDAVYQQREKLDLEPEQRMLLKETWKRFVRGGANLSEAKKEELKALNEELSVLSLQFGENVLKETNRFEMVIDNKDDLVGLPDAVIEAAAEAAVKRGHEDKWVFTLHKPSLIPFLQYSPKRELREKMFTGYTKVGDNGDDLDNNAILARMASLRTQRANLLGFPSHAHYVLDDNMAKTPDKVYELLNKLWTPALAQAKSETTEFQKMIDKENTKKNRFKVEPWDWWYYAEKVKKAKYDLDEEMVRPYFELENVRLGLFDTVNKLYGITFDGRPDIPVYHEHVKAYEVKEADGTTVAIWFSDYFPRESKRGGAWMSSFRKQCYVDGERVIPVIYNVGNFTKPTAEMPALLSADEVGTMFHEFGHALHGMLSDCRYQSLSGTSVARDFVELPSQVMENWAFEPEVLATYAKHYKTGEPIPAELVEKLEKSKHFNQGFATTEYLAASFLDMDWHTIETTEEKDVAVFETESMDRIGLIKEIVSRYRSPYFRHIFSGSYSSGYYSYVWAEVLDADAFEAFKETGNIFDPATAKSFRDNILSRGGTEEPMTLYKQFRGKDPEIGPLLVRKGME
ncbi:MAG: M3 family metallopeptidase [Candidatus Krumholzibacteria bacterium]|nr:M3 family metallopeptidase [Candidatus Krumholzibacteria bacterium]